MTDEEYFDEEEEYDSEEENGGYDEEDDDSLASALQGQFRSAPWYAASLGIHFVALLIMMAFPPPPEEPPRRTVVITSTVEEEPEEEPLEEPEPDIKENEQVVETETEVTVDSPVVVTTTEVEISTEMETDDDMDKETPKGDPNEISDVDNDSTGVPAMMGVGNSGGKGGGGRFGFRNGGGRRKALRAGGGSRRTESAVDWALKWLAYHQESDGHWDSIKYEAGGHGNVDHADTGLACLAFLGAGNSTKFGKYKDNVQRSVEWMMGEQPNAAGGSPECVGPHKYQGGITLMAMAEAFGMSGGAELRESAQKCVDWAVKSQCPKGGWDYQPHNAGRDDTSVTGWWVMGLKSAKVAGLDVPYETLEKALAYIEICTGDDGKKVFYAGATPGPGPVSARRSAIALTVLQFLGRPRTHGKVIACANFQLANLPQAGNPDFYQWYYSALGMFQMGVRSNFWTTWNEPMKTALLTTQRRDGDFTAFKGSWDPNSHHGKDWGRVGETALGALMLEVYYRYEDAHSHSIMK